jgi:hypothetical protein
MISIGQTDIQLSCLEPMDQGIYSRVLDRADEKMGRLRRIREFKHVWFRGAFWFDRCDNGKQPRIMREVIFAVYLRNRAGRPETYLKGEAKGNEELDKVAISYELHGGRCPPVGSSALLCASFVIVMPPLEKLTSQQEEMVAQTAYWQALRLIEAY